MAKVITSLTEEVSSLRQQLDVSNQKEEYYVSLLKRKEEGICQMESQLDQSKRVYESRLEELETDAENGCCCCSTSMIRMQIYLVVLRSCYQIVMLLWWARPTGVGIGRIERIRRVARNGQGVCMQRPSPARMQRLVLFLK